MLSTGIVNEQYKSKFPPLPSQSAHHLKTTLGGLAVLKQGRRMQE